ncbi:unnamed protein product [Cyprideis torosa]|uniref:Uncharacterized protein n=2 Tax=Cyprideis torosa TaxID=163714 RepID=A0A7R8WIG0_9CRUS|nr:unnamed protein product [Cyprideis torosa]CAG0900706.1 unnamed protein product [Cyprideis torosa]
MSSDDSDAEGRKRFYPNVDTKIWLRTCQEVTEPISGKLSGSLPPWLQGTLVRNGPGGIRVGEDEFKHLFDASAVLHRFRIKDGKVTYQNRYVASDAYKKNMAAKRIVVNEFGSYAHPDPCKSIFQRVFSRFSRDNIFTDNTNISVFPFHGRNDQVYALTETPFLHRVDVETLEHLQKEDLGKYISVMTHSAHLHNENNETYSLGLVAQCTGPKYAVIHFRRSEDTVDSVQCSSPLSNPEIVGAAPSTYRMSPAYMHSFSLTEHFFVLIEQPLTVYVPSVMRVHLLGEPLANTLHWDQNGMTVIHLIDRASGKEHVVKYVAKAFFFLHTINAYEEDNHVVLDIVTFKDARMLDCMYTEALKNANYNPEYASIFRGRPNRYVLPLIVPDVCEDGRNLVSLSNTKATAVFKVEKGCCCESKMVMLQPELLVPIGCEVPRINYDFNGRKYRYFYAMLADVDDECPGSLVKVDVESKTFVRWGEENAYPSEPIFVPSPDNKDEDDGVILSAVLRAQGRDNEIALLILDAKSWTEIGRVEFVSPGPISKDLHGWFFPDD